MRCVWLILFIAVAVNAAEIIPSSRLVSWSNNVGVINTGQALGWVPSVTTIYTTLSSTVTISQLNAHLAACPSNQVVKLEAGTYTFDASIDMGDNGRVLRGSGRGQTLIKFTANTLYGNVSFEGSSFSDPDQNPPPNIVNWTNGYAVGETNLMLQSTTGIVPGQMMMIDQLNDNDLVLSTANEGVSYLGRQSGGRLQLQFVRVISTNANGTTVSIFPGLYMPNWNVGSTNDPEAWWFNGSPVEMAGMEDLTITNVSGSSHQVAFLNARNCWVKNIESQGAGSPAGEHIRTYIASRITVRDSKFWKSKSSTSQSYGVNFYWAGDCIAENNYTDEVTSPALLEQATGCVYGYNFATNCLYTTPSDWLIETFSTHGAHCAFNLFEGNHTPNYYIDYIHGTGSHNTMFRSRIAGWETNKTANCYAIAMEKGQLSNSVVACVLGQLGFHVKFEVPRDGPPNSDPSIYRMGCKNVSDCSTEYDSRVTNSVIRHLNYDVLCTTNSGVRWETGITEMTARNSYYLTEKPSWFGFLTWPTFDPSRTNVTQNDPTNIPAGYFYAFGSNPPAAESGGGGVSGQRATIPASSASISGGYHIRQ